MFVDLGDDGADASASDAWTRKCTEGYLVFAGCHKGRCWPDKCVQPIIQVQVCSSELGGAALSPLLVNEKPLWSGLCCERYPAASVTDHLHAQERPVPIDVGSPIIDEWVFAQCDVVEVRDGTDFDFSRVEWHDGSFVRPNETGLKPVFHCEAQLQFGRWGLNCSSGDSRVARAGRQFELNPEAASRVNARLRCAAAAALQPVRIAWVAIFSMLCTRQ